MKKIGLICASILLCGSLTACGNESSSNTSESKNSTSEITSTTNKFGQSVNLTKGKQKAKMVIQNVKVVDPNDDLVTDISHNYKETHQYVIVTYKVTALSNKINLSDFDGSNLSVYDSKGQSSIASSNRDSVTPDELHKGETQVMKIGVGLRAKSSKVTIHFGDETWKGKITNESGSSSADGQAPDPESSQTQSQQAESSSNTTASNGDKATVAGHSFHRENFYGTDVWVGDNNEGELGEWAANDPSVSNNDSVKQQVNSFK